MPGYDLWVTEHKIRTRYDRLRPLAARAMAIADRAFALDNSDPSCPLRGVFQLDRGILCERAQHLPHWAVSMILSLETPRR